MNAQIRSWISAKDGTGGYGRVQAMAEMISSLTQSCITIYMMPIHIHGN